MDFRGSWSQIPDLTLSYFVFFRRTKKDGKRRKKTKKTKKDEVRSSGGPLKGTKELEGTKNEGYEI